MKYLFIIITSLIISHSFAKDILIVDFGGKRKLINTHKYSNTGKITTYTIEGTFTDNLANYGAWDSMVITQIENGKIDEDTGIGKVVVIGASNSMSSLIDTKCTYSIKILNENVFGVQKCDLSNDSFKTLKNLER